MIHVAYALTDKTGQYYTELARSMCSVMENSADAGKLCFHIIHDYTLADSAINRLNILAYFFGSSISFHNVETECMSAYHWMQQSLHPVIKERYGLACMYRLFIFDLLPKDCKKVIYLDADTIINMDISDLWEYPVASDVGAVLDYLIAAGAPSASRLCDANVLNMSSYFNSGVLVIKRNSFFTWTGVKDKLKAFFSEYELPEYPDQDFLNIHWQHNYTELPRRFNNIVNLNRFFSDYEIEPAIYHYAGNSKQRNCEDCYDALLRLYAEMWTSIACDEISSLILEFQNAAIRYDVYTMQDIVYLGQVSLYKRSALNNSKLATYFNSRSNVHIACILYALASHNGPKAIEVLRRLSESVRETYQCIFYFGMAYYELEQYQAAEQYFQKLAPTANELVEFFLGNCYLYLGWSDKAAQHYDKTLQKRQSMYEARYNLETVQLGKEDIIRYPWESSLDMTDCQNVRDIPIFINSRDRLGCLQKLMGWLLREGFSNIYILDNDSSYEPLLRYYIQLTEESKAKIILLKKNWGHKAIWDSGILERLNITTPYVYTDSDVVPEDECNWHILEAFLDVLKSNPYVLKVGFAIKFSDINKKEFNKIINNEKMYSTIPIGNSVFFAPVDTTFALYRNVRFYSVREGIRIKKNGCELLHLPWYYDINNPPKDERFYLQRANLSSTYKKWLIEKQR